MAQRSCFNKDDVIATDYKVKRKIGEGQFAEVYEVEHVSDNQCFALKIEKSGNVRTLKQEIKVIKHMQGCPSFPSLRDNGTEDGKAFAILDLFGYNLAEVKRLNGPSVLPLFVTKHICLLLLNALETFHNKGYIHRDVKPANFITERNASLQAPETADWFLIDFGLARRYREDNGNLIPERQNASFRGSTTYASIHSHDEKDLSRRDDLWSWFYIIVELIVGTLPWRTNNRPDATPETNTAGSSGGVLKGSVADMKRECISRPLLLFGGLSRYPSALLDMHKYLLGLTFESTPEYSTLRNLLERIEYDALMPVVEETPTHRPMVRAPILTKTPITSSPVDAMAPPQPPPPPPPQSSVQYKEYGGTNGDGRRGRVPSFRGRVSDANSIPVASNNNNNNSGMNGNGYDAYYYHNDGHDDHHNHNHNTHRHHRDDHHDRHRHDKDNDDSRRRDRHDSSRRDGKRRRHREDHDDNNRHDRSRSRQRRQSSKSPHKDNHNDNHNNNKDDNDDQSRHHHRHHRDGERRKRRKKRSSRDKDKPIDEQKQDIAHKLLALAPQESLEVMRSVIDGLAKNVDGKNDEQTMALNSAFEEFAGNLMKKLTSSTTVVDNNNSNNSN